MKFTIGGGSEEDSLGVWSARAAVAIEASCKEGRDLVVTLHPLVSAASICIADSFSSWLAVTNWR